MKNEGDRVANRSLDVGGDERKRRKGNTVTFVEGGGGGMSSVHRAAKRE